MLGLITKKKHNEILQELKQEYEDKINFEVKKITEEHQQELKQISDQHKKAVEFSLEAQKEFYVEKIDTIKKNNQELLQNNKSLAARNEALSNAHRNSTTELHESRKENTKLNLKIINLEDDISKITEENKKLRMSNGGFKTVSKKHIAKISQLKKDLKSATDKIIELSKEIADKKVKPTIEAIKVYTGSKKDKKKYRGLSKKRK